jgi:hypothetical protein
MPCDIIWEPQGVRRHFYGHMSPSDLLHSIEAVHGDMRFDDLHYSLNDFLDVTSSDIEPNTLMEGAAHAIGATLSNTRLVMLMVVADPTIREKVRRFTGPPLSSFRAEFFETREDARDWIAKHVAGSSP